MTISLSTKRIKSTDKKLQFSYNAELNDLEISPVLSKLDMMNELKLTSNLS
jgi:hypothetical protein